MARLGGAAGVLLRVSRSSSGFTMTAEGVEAAAWASVRLTMVKAVWASVRPTMVKVATAARLLT
jgi:hypothetical protein